MEDRITLNFLYFGLASAALAFFLSCIAFQRTFYTQFKTNLRQQSELIASVYDPELGTAQLESFDLSDGVVAEILSSDEINNKQPELKDALETGTGFDERQNTSGYKEIFYVQLLSNGSILCLHAPLPKMTHFWTQNFSYIIFDFFIIVLLAFLSSLLITHRLLKPIRDLPHKIEQPDFDPQNFSVYPELIPLLEEISQRRNERETMRQEFTANVSHELKTPLTTISGYSEMISSGLARPEDIPYFATKIHQEAERMQTLVGDIIELNALDNEVVHNHNDDIDMLSLVQDCVEQLAPHFAARNLSVYIAGDGFHVQGNHRQLWELVYNLLDNARRYNVNGGMIRIYVQDHMLSVKDTGIGIPKEHQARVFERFYRVDKSHSRASGGTGLGLSIVKHAAELHHAVVELESAEHIGTEVKVRFPS